jgi:tRNA pseudouridine55 synthase
MNGFLFLDKPEGITSFGVVRKARRLLGVKKIGHCGTLDPLATGLLILCVGKATKLAQFIIGEKKSYTVDVMLGWKSTTYDRDGELTEVGSTDNVNRAKIEAALSLFSGTIKQRPPIFSALKHRGKALYKYARENKSVVPAEREVHIYDIEITDFDLPRLSLRLTCSKGTYVRSLVHDLGESLGCGGYVDALRRTSIGEINIEQAITMENFEKIAASGKATDLLIDMVDLLPFPSVFLSDDASIHINDGVEIRSDDIVRTESPLSISQVVAIRGREGELLAVGRSLLDEGHLRSGGATRAIEYIRVI